MPKADRSSRLSQPLLLLLATAALALAGASHLPAQEASVVKRIQLVAPETGRAVWSPKGDRIAFERRGDKGYTQLWVADEDFTGERCVSCNLADLKKRHIGNPSWHPSGDFLIAQIEHPVKTGGEPMRFLEVPGGNLGSDLCFIRTDGRDFFNLTNLGERGGRVLSPRFSHEGGELAWAERLASGDGVFGRWALRVARLEVKRGIPRLKGTRTFKPGETGLFFDSHGFTTDDQGLVLSGNLEPGQPEAEMDIYRLAMKSGALKRLTQTDKELDRFALPAPNGNWIAWTSSRDIGTGEVDLQRRQVTAVRAADLWLMNGEGLSQQRLTRFNDVHSPNYGGKTMAVPTAWNRQGDKLLLLALPVGSNAPGDLYLIEFNEPIGR